MGGQNNLLFSLPIFWIRDDISNRPSRNNHAAATKKRASARDFFRLMIWNRRLCGLFSGPSPAQLGAATAEGRDYGYRNS
jgi:hypothetical protein